MRMYSITMPIMYNVVELRAYRILYNVTKLIYAKENLWLITCLYNLKNVMKVFKKNNLIHNPANNLMLT